MKKYKEADVKNHSSLTSTLDGIEWSALCTDRFIPRKVAPNYKIICHVIHN
jgi:hypothetical protein